MEKKDPKTCGNAQETPGRTWCKALKKDCGNQLPTITGNICKDGENLNGGSGLDNSSGVSNKRRLQRP